MTTIVPRSDDINDPTTGGTRAAIPRIKIGTGAIVIAVGDDTKSTFFNSWRESTSQGPSTA